MTNVCPMDNPCCVLSAFRLPPHVFVPRQGSQRSYTCLVRQAQPRQENLCLPHYRITHLTEDSVKVDALTGEVKSIIKWPGDSRLIVTAVFRCNTVYLKLIFFLMSGSTFRLCLAFCGDAMVSMKGCFPLCFAYWHYCCSVLNLGLLFVILPSSKWDVLIKDSPIRRWYIANSCHWWKLVIIQKCVLSSRNRWPR